MTTSRLISTLAASSAAALLVLAPGSAATASTGSVDGGALPPLLGAPAEPTATAAAPDQQLQKGCADYPVRYAVRDAGDDWMLDLVVSDRAGEQVASLSLHAVEHGAKGWATFSVCREVVEAGRFTVAGVLTERDGYEQVEHAVEADRFRLTR